MNVLNLYISVILICFGFRYSNFEFFAENYRIYHHKESTKEFVRNFRQIMQNKPNFHEVKIALSSFMTSKYEKMDALIG